MTDSTQAMLALERLALEGAETRHYQVPVEWRPFLRPCGAPLSGVWVTPEDYTVALCRLPMGGGIAVIRPAGSAPAAYLRTPAEALAFIAVDVRVYWGVFTRAELAGLLEVPA